VKAFRGVPFAAPPVRENRWRPPQPVKNWAGARLADRFADQCMQARAFGDMMFRNSGVSEDCLYLNVWMPANASASSALPVLVYYYGGGFVAGDGSEPRYDGESMAKRGIVVVTTSYRLGVFGFFSHPELTAESAHHASGNYSLMDQGAALQWVRDNIARFGGDPKKVTIAGESAGSFAVSAQMASPMARDLIAGAIGESGAFFSTTISTRRAIPRRRSASPSRRRSARRISLRCARCRPPSCSRWRAGRERRGSARTWTAGSSPRCPPTSSSPASRRRCRCSRDGTARR
jgi:para-nitrobenzyl esterase